MIETLWNYQVEDIPKPKPRPKKSQAIIHKKSHDEYVLVDDDYDNDNTFDQMSEQEDRPRQRQALSVPDKLIEQVQGLDLTLSVNNGDLLCTDGDLPAELAQALQENKEWVIIILSLPTPARPGEELEQLRREIGEMVRDRQEKRAA